MKDAIKVFKTKLVRKTRKKHECWGCGKKQPKGSEMVNTTFSYDDRLVSVYHCTECKSFLIAYNKNIKPTGAKSPFKTHTMKDTILGTLCVCSLIVMFYYTLLIFG